MHGYLGSIAFSGRGREIAMTAPRGGLAIMTDMTGAIGQTLHHLDICGVAPGAEGFIFTTGTGAVLRHSEFVSAETASHNCNWDNHLVKIGQV